MTGFARERLAPYKVPKTVEFVDSIPRSEAMKFNRAALVEERDGPDPESGRGRGIAWRGRSTMLPPCPPPMDVEPTMCRTEEE